MKKAKIDRKNRSGHKKGGAAQIHHPWDEVSLPGAGEEAGTVNTEQPTVFKVLNQVEADETSKIAASSSTKETICNTADKHQEQQQLHEIAASNNNNGTTNFTDNAQEATPKHHSVLKETDADAAARTNFESDILVNSISSPIEINKEPFSDNSNEDSQVVNETTDTVSNQTTNTDSVDFKGQQSLQHSEQQQHDPPQSPHVLDVEPHLIETYDEYHTTEIRNVGINELPPIKDELIQGSSKIETETNVRTIIEVEPAGSRTIKAVAKTLEQSQQLPTIDEVQNSSTTRTSVILEPSFDINEEIRKAADKLVQEIEQQVLETLRQDFEKKNQKATESLLVEEEKTIKNETQTDGSVKEDVNTSLSQKVDKQLSEVTSILKGSSTTSVTLNARDAHGESISVAIDHPSQADQVKIVELNGLPSLNSSIEAEERKLFIESLPQITEETDTNKLAADCKRDYYKSLRKYLVQQETDKPPVPLQTYRWEDLRRARDRGGYPWTHLYKRPLGPDDEPEIVLLLRKSQEFRFTSESPKSLKKVRYDEQVLVKETERYIQELSEEEDTEDVDHTTTEDEESHSLHSESHSCVSDSVLAVGKRHKSNRLDKIRGILKRRKGGRSTEDAQSLPGTSVTNSRRHSEDNLSEQLPQQLTNGQEHKTPRCFPIMKKLKSMADRQKKRLHIKKISLKKDEKIILGEETKIIRLKSSPKSDRGEIPHFIEKQDSDDVLEIVELDESPSRKRRDDGKDDIQDIEMDAATNSSIVKPDEIIEISNELSKTDASETDPQTPEPTVSEILEEEIKSSNVAQVEAILAEPPPRKTPRLRREHVYEEIDQGDTVGEQLNEILEMASVEALKKSLTRQDDTVVKDLEAANKQIPLDRMGSSEEEQLTGTADISTKESTRLLAPISSIESASSDDDRSRPQLSPVAEESDAASIDERKTNNQADINEITNAAEITKPSIKKEASPAPSDKKVTFSHVEDEAEPHREDIELPEDVKLATGNRWKHMSDHEYEPIGEAPASEGKLYIPKEPSPARLQAQIQNQESMEVSTSHDDLQAAENMQKDLEERYFSSTINTPRTESRTDYEIHKSQVDSSALEELSRKPEKKGFIASAQDRTRKMQAGIKTQAGKIKTKLRTPAKKSPSSSPKTKERKRFKAPEFSKIRMPEIKRPDMSKLKDFKRPEFTKFNKPDMSKFKLPEKFSTLKIRRSKSFKENESVPEDDDMTGVVAEPSGTTTAEAVPQQKKLFEFNFGTYPRAFRRKKKPVEPEPSFETGTGTEGPSVITTTGTQPSMESSSSPQGDRGPGPVRSRWADKFSDVSYNDSEGSRYRRYGSEQESFDRESSLERRMREDLEDAVSEEAATNLGILGGVTDQKQFAEFDEENRAIHEISNLRAGEFKRRPMVHQDSDLISEESKENVGWTDKEIQKNKLLRKAELEAEASYLNHPSDDGITQETQSTASSGKKNTMEETDDDEFFLRKRGNSEDIELRQYISTAIREGFDMPVNALQHVGRTSEPIEYGDYDVPPPKPRRLHKVYRPEDASQEFDMQRSEYDDDMSISQNGSDFLGAPKRPMRKGHSRSKYSMDSQDIPMADQHHEQYFDDDEEYLRPPPRMFVKAGSDGKMNDLNIVKKEVSPEVESTPGTARPQAPRRRKRQQRDSSAEKEAYINGFGGRSVSNSFLQPPEDVIVYRTEHEYHIPLATPENYTDGASAASRKSRSLSRFDDDRTSQGADSLAMDNILRNELESAKRQLLSDDDAQEKFIIDMMENDGYAIVRKDHIPKPTPPARRKKFSRSPGERFATMPNMRTKRSSPAPPERPPPPRGYSPATAEPIPPLRKSALSLDENQDMEDDYEEPEPLNSERPETPRNLQSGAIINKMKYRPLPPPPRPPREKKQRGASGKGFMQDDGQDEQESNFDDRDGGGERIASSSTADSYEHNGDFEDDPHFVEVEVSTQTDPLPDDFVCEEFEITEDMKIIEPRKSGKTLEDLIQEEQEELERNRPLTEDEQLAKGLQKFRDANQRSLSERSRASSQADRSKSQSRPQTPSAVIIERRVSTPIPNREAKESILEASLIVRPIDDLDLEEEELRREGLLTDSSQQSKSDVEEEQILASDYSHDPSSIELEEAIESLRSQAESERETEDDKEVERTMQERLFKYYEIEETHSTLRLHLDESDGDEKRETLTLTDEEDKKELLSKESTPPPNYDEEYFDYLKEEISKDPIKYNYESNLSKGKEREETALEIDPEIEITQGPEPLKMFVASQAPVELLQSDLAKQPASPQQSEPPLAPPRRRSTTVIEPPFLAIVESQLAQEIATQKSLLEPTLPVLPTHMTIADLEVERLRVHALQAGQIVVSQLHGTQISSDELECKSGNLVVKNIELPPGFIEDIVERVRISERGQLQAAETQTSPKTSQELLAGELTPPTVRESVPPPKPPRQKDLEAAIAATTTMPKPTAQQQRDLDEDTTNQSTQTLETTVTSSSPPPPAFPTVDYLQSLAPLAFYNLRNIEQDELNHRRRRHYRRSRESSPSEEDDEHIEGSTEQKEPNETDEQPVERRRHRTRSATRPSSEQQQSVAQAGRQFLSACSLSLVNIINQLTDSVRNVANKEMDPTTRSNRVPTLVILFILITFGILLFLLSGKSVHHHHWDYFNPPGNAGRLS